MALAGHGRSPGRDLKSGGLRPDYGGGSLVNLMASLAARFGYDTGYPQARALSAQHLQDYKKIVVIVIDGLGYRYLKEIWGSGFLAEHLLGQLTSVFPSTTASALTTLATGQPPLRHGATGWFTYLPELGSIANILKAEPRHGGGKYPWFRGQPDTLLKSPSLFSKLRATCMAVVPEDIAGSRFQQSLSCGARVVGFRGLGGFCRAIDRSLRATKADTFITGYWPDLDGLAHRFGVYHGRVRDHYHRIEQALRRLCLRHRQEGTLFIIIADHGLVDTPERQTIDVRDHPALASTLLMPLCGEPRAAYCYLLRQRTEDFKDYIAERLGSSCLLLTRREAIAAGLFGPGRPEPWFEGRVGDCLLIMKKGWAIRDFLPGEPRIFLKSGHGGLTPDEILVPLMVFPR